MMNVGGSRSKLKTGARPGLARQDLAPGKTATPVFKSKSPAQAKHDRFFKRGSLMFIEGEKGDTMYIIKSGKIKILKQEGSKTIELAVLGPGSVLGEMSLLIDMSRSATAQVIEDVTALAINKQILEDTYTKVPPWLVSVIKVVVKRLRDTLRKNSDNLISDNIGGLVNLILLLVGDGVADEEGKITLSMDLLKEEALYTIGVSGGDTDKIITELILKELLVIGKDEKGNEVVEIKKLDILNLYFEYLLAHYNGKTIPGENMTDETKAFAKILFEAGLEKGTRQNDGSISISRPPIEIAMERAGTGRFLNMDAIDELKNSNIIELNEPKTSTQPLTHKKMTIGFFENKLKKALLVKEWVNTFASED